jgi:hypothetical protein
VLRYLKMCARSAAFDVARSKTVCVSLDDSPIEVWDRKQVPAEEYVDQDARARMWAIVNATLKTQRERVVAYLAYEHGLKSAEIQARRPDLFESVADVYRVSRNVIDRLKRNHDLIAWFTADRELSLGAGRTAP